MLLLPLPLTVKKRLPSMGTSVSATNREQSRANTTTRASSLNNMPEMVCMKTTGRKIIEVVRVEAMIAPVTCLVPIRALSLRDFPFSLILTMFSSTTMELSTIIPIPSASPPKVIRLRVMLSK